MLSLLLLLGETYGWSVIYIFLEKIWELIGKLESSFIL